MASRCDLPGGISGKPKRHGFHTRTLVEDQKNILPILNLMFILNMAVLSIMFTADHGGLSGLFSPKGQMARCLLKPVCWYSSWHGAPGGMAIWPFP